MNEPWLIASWFQKRAKRDARRRLLAALGTMAAAALVLFLTFWAIYGVVWLLTFWNLAPTHETRQLISGITLILIVMSNARANHRVLEGASFMWAESDEPIPTPGTFVKLIASILGAGPHLLLASFRLIAAARRLSRLDIEGCAAVLALLLEQDGRVPFDDIAEAIPPGHDLEEIVRQLRDIDGVLFLTAEPAGLALMSELRGEMRKAKRE